jgi:hypothetical protein
LGEIWRKTGMKALTELIEETECYECTGRELARVNMEFKEKELEWIMKAMKRSNLDLVKNSDFQLTLGK